MRIHLNIGANMGERAACIARAVEAVAAAWPEARMRVSAAVESEPWGFESEHRFMNVGVMLDMDTAAEPLAVLDTVQEIERRTGGGTPHRNADGSYRDRTLDIDIIDIDGMRLDSARLTLPHPRAALRSFVMEPLRELDPATADAIIRGAAR